MRNILIIFFKELKRVFLDRRMLISLFLPGVIIYFAYTLMGNAMNSSMFSSTTKNTEYQIVYTDNYNNDKSNAPKLLTFLDSALKSEGQGNTFKAEAISKDKLEEKQTALKEGNIHLILSFTDNFEESIKTDGAVNNISIYYNGESNASNDLYNYVTSLVSYAYTNYTVNMENGKTVAANIGDKDVLSMKILGMVIPMVTISILFSTVISLCPEAIAGEKERGTLASLLLTPIKRRDFAIGKMLSLSVLAIASGAVSFIGLMASMPNLMKGIDISIAPVEFLLLFFLIISILLFFVSLGIMMSSLANTVKEAAGYVSPFMLVFMLFGIAPSLFGLTQWYTAFVPVLNVCVSINSVLVGAEGLPLYFGLTIISNIVYTGIMVFFITKLFNKEKVILGQ